MRHFPHSPSHSDSMLRALARRYETFHVTVGLLGNSAFVCGSALFLATDYDILAKSLFLMGSTGMLIGSIGRALVDFEKRHVERGAAHRRHRQRERREVR